MKKIYLLSFLSLSFVAVKAQLYSQSFSTDMPTVSNGPVTEATYVATTSPSASQLTYLATNASGSNSITVSGGTLQIVTSSTGSTWAAVRNDAFAGPPAALMVKFKANLDVGSSGSNPKWFFYVGSGFTNGIAAEAAANVHSGFSIRYGNSAYYFVKTLANGGNEATADRIADLTDVHFTFVTNNSGGTLTYTAPDGTFESIANDTWDLWTETTKRFDDQAATTPGQTLSNIKFGDNVTSSGGRANWILDTVVVTPSPFILPLNFTGIKAFLKGSNIHVDWSSANEMNVDKFEIERSNSGTSFAVIAAVRASNTRTNNYSWVDNAPYAVTNFYRIKAIDKDGKYKYSDVVKVSTSSKGDISVLPNPIVGHTLSLQLSQMKKGSYDLQLVNALGQVIAKQTIQVDAGSSVQSINLPASVVNGNYYLQLEGNGAMFSKNVLVKYH
jgi:hypothetical protein